ncbi:MAG: D-alanyl-D-alanine carboxypeptidase [Rhodospirillales bacterium]|nr:D-alanyl-D-alanine carboxypeptidase [Rhodospirillales bacterium]
MRYRARLAAKLLGGAMLLVAAILNAGDRAEAAAYAALVMDAATGRILSQVDADQPRYPASLTKMMTLYMLFEALDSKKLKLSTPMKVSALAASRPPSRLGLHEGDTISVREAILALVTKSANDVATVVAERLGGSETRFAQRMTVKARALGMKRTTFRNASGLPHDSQITTARDMALLGRALLRRFPQYYVYFSEPAFDYDGQRYANHNHLLGNYDGIDGIKTGYIHASGFNLVASAKRDGRRLIGVIFGARSPAERSYKMAGLLDQGFDSLPPVRVAFQMNPRRPATAVPTVAPAPARETMASPEPKAAAIRTALPAAIPEAVAGDLPGVMIASNDIGAALEVVNDRAWGIQVGAFSAPRSALARAKRAAKLAASIVADASVEVVQHPDEGQTRYLSRIHGLSRNDADAACARLQAKMGCFVVALDTVDAAPASGGVAAVAAAETSRSQDGAGTDADWGVQVGVYPRRAAALVTATDARAKAPGPLAAGMIKVVPLKGRRGPLYRARILGLDKERAYSACRVLEAAGSPCMVLRMNDDDREQLAAAL